MRIFISEFVCGGGWPERELAGSLAKEGRAMLCAVVADFARIPGVKVTTTWDARLGSPPFENIQTIVVDSAPDELPIFRELADLCDATLVIAPETHGLLEQRCRIVEGTRGGLLGPGSRAVALCTSKLQTARRLEQGGVPTIPTMPVRFNRDDRSLAAAAPDSVIENLTYPIVVKPDDGAGSQSTWLIRDEAEFERLQHELESDPLLARAVRQPYIRGRALSVAVLIAPDSERIETFPPARQMLSDDGRFHYLGGVLPARDVDNAAIQNAARAACRVIDGLRGYVGVDLIVPDASPDQPLVVEINPRLTSSYIGYRQLTDANLAERMLNLSDPAPIIWRDTPLAFNVCGPGA